MYVIHRSDFGQTFLRYFDTRDWRDQYSASFPGSVKHASLSTSRAVSLLADLRVVCGWAVLEPVEATKEKGAAF